MPCCAVGVRVGRWRLRGLRGWRLGEREPGLPGLVWPCRPCLLTQGHSCVLGSGAPVGVSIS